MPPDPGQSLDALLAEAASADPADRIGYRDAIAAYGAEAIRALEPWLVARETATFAVLTITRAADADRKLAVTVLRRAMGSTESSITKSDIADALAKLGVRPTASSTGRRVREKAEVYEPMALDELVVGRHYERAELHARGLGGNPQSGLSYPADGDYVMLFSNPRREGETGYHDRWDGPNEILYYGKWDGDTEMRLDAGNRKFIERSPELHLFTADRAAYKYEGRFEYIEHFPEQTVRDGEPARAIVFRLRRVS